MEEVADEPGIKPMDVTLGPELEEPIRNKVKSGRCPSESEVVREALRLLHMTA